MIKIIKSGNTRKEITCDKCYCIFSYTSIDVNKDKVTCPECNNKISTDTQE